MRTHYCHEEKDWITLDGECNWCGMKEDAPRTTDDEFRQMMAKLEAAARPDITDD